MVGADFLQQEIAEAPGRVRYGYEISWKRAEVRGPPADLIELINGAFDVISSTSSPKRRRRRRPPCR